MTRAEYHARGVTMLPPATCQACGKDIPPRAKSHYKGKAPVFCSRSCVAKGRDRGIRKKAKAEAQERKRANTQIACFVCGRISFAKVKNARVCPGCQAEWARRHARAINETKVMATKQRQATCRECGKVFSRDYGIKRRMYCSDQCLKRQTKRISTAVRRARKEGLGWERVDPIAVLWRDKWHCQLCGGRTPKYLRGTLDERAPELDHIVPIALGGAHTWANTQCACRRCNQRKGATTRGQLRIA